MQQDAESLVNSALEPGETVLWSGSPRQGLVFRFYDRYMVPLGVVWLLLAVFGVSVARHVLDPGFSAAAVLWLSLTVLAGVVALYLVGGRFFLDSSMRRRTRYFLTSQKVIIVSGFSRRKVKSYDLGKLKDVSVRFEAGEVGTICFGRESAFGWYLVAWYGIWNGSVPRFDLIDNARSVYGLIKAAMGNTGIAGR